MNFADLFQYLYLCVPIFSQIGYIPQFVSLFKAEDASMSFSVQAFTVWMFNAFVSFGYGVFFLQDFMLSLTMGAVTLSNAALISMALFNRFYGRGLYYLLFDKAESPDAGVYSCPPESAFAAPVVEGSVMGSPNFDRTAR